VNKPTRAEWEGLLYFPSSKKGEERREERRLSPWSCLLNRGGVNVETKK